MSLFAKSSIRGLSLCAIGMLLLVACQSYTSKSAEMRGFYRSQQYDQALQALEDSELAKQKRNRLLYSMEKAMILERSGERAKARRELIDADRIADELYTISVSSEAASFLLNDSMSEYRGEDFEVVAIQLMLALSFIEDGDLASALVAARRLNTRLNAINENYDQDGQRYQEDAFARFLAGLIYEARGETDSAIIDYQAALRTYEGAYKEEFFTPPPDVLVFNLMNLLQQRNRRDRLAPLQKKYPEISKKLAAQSAQKNMGQLVVIHEIGHVALKQHEDFVVPFGGDILRFSFPYIQYQPRQYGRTGINVASRFERAELGQNFDAIASKNLEDRRLRMILKHGARLIIKSQIRQKTEQEFGPLAGLAVSVINAVTETADTRGWTGLAARLEVSRVHLPAGEHSIEIYTAGQLSEIRRVKIEPGKMQLLRAVN